MYNEEWTVRGIDDEARRIVEAIQTSTRSCAKIAYELAVPTKSVGKLLV